jgi:hypothetical protein
VAFVNLEKQLFENTTVMLKPRVTVISSSVGGGATGSAHIYPVRSPRIRRRYSDDFTVQIFNTQGPNAFDEATAFNNLIGLSSLAAFQGPGIESVFNTIDNQSSQFPIDRINNKTIPICRFDSPTFFNKEHTIINNIVKVLQPHHQHRYPDSGLHYGNYHTLNFFTGSEVPNDACLIYPNVTGTYHPENAFSLDFWINPRYDNQTAGAEYHAGTIFHMSSSIALSLVSGSQTDEFGKVSSFKLLLQLSQSADYNPRTVDLSNPNDGGSYPRDLIFTSSHELNKNHWHHVCVRWGGQNTNNYSGSIVIDDKSTSFYIPSASVHTDTYNRFAGSLDYDTIVIGNFFDSTSFVGQGLFNSTDADVNGTYDRGGSEPSSAIQEAAFTNGLNAEIHDIKFFHKYLNDQELEFLKYNGISDQPILNSNGENVSQGGNLYRDSLKFYVPVFFCPTSFYNREVKLISFFNSSDTQPPTPGFQTGSRDYKLHYKTHHPFNVELSNRVAVREINLENFVADLKNVNGGNETSGFGMPRLQSLTSSLVDTNSQTVDKFTIFESKQAKKRNLTVLPNDNGLFSPNYFAISDNINKVLFEGNALLDGQKNALVARNVDNSLSRVDISKTVPYGPLTDRPFPLLVPDDDIARQGGDPYYRLASSNLGQDGDQFNSTVGVTPEIPISEHALATYLCVPSRLRTDYSNQMTAFDISNLYFGNRIDPGSFEIYDNAVTGSGGIVKIRLKDNENGSLYRADCLTKQATWNNIGDIFYDEGLVLIKSPHVSYYCKDRTEISLRGEQNLHTLIMNIPVEAGLVNSSSNTTFKSMPPSENINDSDKEAIYVTGVNIHDNNFNIIMKAHFAQPIIKADDDEFIIRLKQDF